MNDIIAGGLVSIGTYTISKLLDLWQAERTFIQDKKRDYFNRKLNAFEKATSYHAITHSSINMISNIMNTMNNEDANFPPEIVDNMMKSVSENLAFVHKQTQDVALSLPLYIDLEKNDKNEMLVNRYLNIIGEMGMSTLMINFFNEERKIPGKYDPAKLDESIDKEIEAITAKASELVSISNLLKGEMEALIDKMRDQVRKYED